MARILVIGDLHFKYELSYSSLFKDGRRSEWNAVKKTLHDTAKNADAVVLLGDNFNSRNNHSIVLTEFVEFLKDFGDKEIHILVGNHERASKSTALDFLKRINHPKWFIYTEAEQVKIAGIDAMMIPFLTPALVGVETKEEGVKEILNKFSKTAFPLCFAHHAISSSKLHGSLLDDWNEIILPKEIIEQHFSHTFAGHIHSKQYLFPSIQMTGDIFTNEMGEHNKSAWVYESDGNIDVSITEIPMPCRGIYKLIWEQHDFIKNVIPLNSIIKCYVTKKETNLEDVKKYLKSFDGSILVEQYENERTKTHFEEGIDLSLDGLLKLYAEARKVSFEDLKGGLLLIS